MQVFFLIFWKRKNIRRGSSEKWEPTIECTLCEHSIVMKKGAADSFDRSLFRILLVTVHSYLFISRFHARMKICLQKGTKGAPLYEQK